MSMKRIVLLAMVIGLALPAMATGGIILEEKVLRDGTRARIGDDRMIIIIGGKEIPAKDGHYEFRDGTKVEVKGGRIVNPGAIKGFNPQPDPPGKGKAVGGAKPALGGPDTKTNQSKQGGALNPGAAPDSAKTSIAGGIAQRPVQPPTEKGPLAATPASSSSSAASGSGAPSPSAAQIQTTNAAISPSQLNFGHLYSGDMRRLSVAVMPGGVAMVAGHFTATLSSSPVFRIVEVQVLGIPGPDSIPLQSASAVNLPKPPDSNATKTRTPGTPPRANAKAEAPISKVLATKTNEPFTLPVKPGDKIVVTIESAPVFDLAKGTLVDNYKAALTLKGHGWHAEVPVSESFDGLKLGLMSVLETYERMLYKPESYLMHKNYPVPVGMTLINADKKLHNVTITATQLPPGFSLSPVTILVGSQQTKKLVLPIQVQWGGGDGGTGAGQSAALNVASEGGAKSLSFSFTVLPSSKAYHFSGNEGPQWSLDYTIHSDGRQKISYHVTNDNVAVKRKFSFDIFWNGHKLGSAAGTVGQLDAKSLSWGYKLGFIESNYPLMLQTTPVVKFAWENTL